MRSGAVRRGDPPEPSLGVGWRHGRELLAGVVAGLLFRGIRLLHVPTTLLAASDAAISLKQAVNAHGAKNSFGLYLPPSAVVVDMTCLDTLPERELRSGFAELVKNALAIRPETAAALRQLGSRMGRWTCEHWSELINLGVAVKLDVLADDPMERQVGLVFEYGHTVGHAVEWVSSIVARQEGLSHGESVAFGMRVAARVAHRLGVAPEALCREHDDLLEDVGLLLGLPDGVALDRVMETVTRDNKRGQIDMGPEECAMVLLRELGRPAGDPSMPLLPVHLNVVRDSIEEVASPRTFRGHRQSAYAQ